MTPLCSDQMAAQHLGQHVQLVGRDGLEGSMDRHVSGLG
jgi:hypothetical protein